MSVHSRDGAASPRAAPDGTEDTLALVLAYYEAFNASDFAALRTLCAPDVALTIEAGRLQGHDALVGFFADIHHHFPGIRVEVRVTALTPEHVVCENSRTVDSSWTRARCSSWPRSRPRCAAWPAWSRGTPPRKPSSQP